MPIQLLLNQQAFLNLYQHVKKTLSFYHLILSIHSLEIEQISDFHDVKSYTHF